MKNLICIILLFVSPMKSFFNFKRQELCLDGKDWRFRFQDEVKDYPSEVPGSIYADMISNNLIPDPYYGNNSLTIEWIANKNVTFSKSFNVPESHLKRKYQEIVFEGLNTHAQVFLNGKLILESHNFNRVFRVEVSRILARENKLEISFSPVKEYNEEIRKKFYKEIEIPADNKERKPFSRSPNYNYGWDFAMKALGPSIEKSVFLEFFDVTYILDFSVATEKILAEDKVSLRLIVDLFFQGKEKPKFEMKKRKKAKFAFIKDFKRKEDIIRNLHQRNKPSEYQLHFLIFNLKTELLVFEKSFEIRNHLSLKEFFPVDKIELWWPNSYGNQPLYTFVLELFHRERLIDKKEFVSGFKTSRLVQKEDSHGKSFSFEVNGQQIYAKGSNVVPYDVFYRGERKNFLKKIVKTAKNSNFNFLRVWGGGKFMPSIFYHLCDVHGILVWQDFLFANEMYPAKSEFMNNIVPEIIGNIRFLRNHVSLLHWNGNNEIVEAWTNWGLRSSLSEENVGTLEYWYDSIFLMMIPQFVDEFDGLRSYTDTSPRYGWGHPESLNIGDSHSWWVWVGGEPIESYKEMIPRFATEFGMQAFPSLASLQRFIPKSEMQVISETMAVHEKHATGFETLYRFADMYFFPTANLDYFVYISQMMQALTIRTAAEAQRTSSGKCSGTLFWQFNDAWPAISWSAIDYYGSKKALVYDAKRFFHPILLTYDLNKEHLIVVTEKMPYKFIEGQIEVQVFDFKGGKPLLDKTIILQILNFQEERIKFPDVKKIIDLKSNSSVFLSLKLIHEHKVLSENIVFFDRPRNLDLDEKPDVRIEIHGKEITIVADVFIYGLYLYHKSDELDLSDNFFHLIQGVPKTIISSTHLSQSSLEILHFNKIKSEEKDNKAKIEFK